MNSVYDMRDLEQGYSEDAASPFAICNDTSKVELWSEKRLPFEPQGWLKKMRDTLRAALKQMTPEGQAMLYARYSSGEKYIFDVENVLFYNVGNSAFSHLDIRHLLFERVFEKASHLEEDKNFPHNQQYSCSLPVSPYWDKRSSLAALENVICPPLNGSLKPHAVWSALKRTDIQVYERAILSEPLGFNVTICIPRNANINVIAGLKALLDGVIAAFHVHNGANLLEVAMRLSNVMSASSDEMELMLMDSIKAVLGSRDLVQSYRSGIKWNPADDRLVHVEIKIEIYDQEEWSMSGELFVATPYKK